MSKLLLICVLLCMYKDVVLSSANEPNLPEKVTYKLDNINNLFKEFSNEYKKEYSSAEEEHRRKVFEENLININRWNREQPDAVFGISPFTDITYEEFIKTHAGCLGNFSNNDAMKYEPNGMAPESLDWRQSNLVTRIKNQQSCGSCYVFSAIGTIEGQYAKNHKQLIELSEQQGLDCNPRGCEGGFPHEVMQSLAKQGCMRESDYPYEGRKGQCRTNANKVVVKISGGNQISVSSEEALKDAVARHGPIAVSMTVERRMLDFKGGIFKPVECQNSQDHHAVLLVGYGSENGTPYWILKNSWGPQWSEGGYLRLVRGQKACNIGDYVAIATVA